MEEDTKVQVAADRFNEAYRQAMNTSLSEAYFNAALLARQLVLEMGRQSIITDSLIGEQVNKATYRISGTATRSDKVRGIKVGDPDEQIIIASSLEEAMAKSDLSDKTAALPPTKLNKDW